MKLSELRRKVALFIAPEINRQLEKRDKVIRVYADLHEKDKAEIKRLIDKSMAEYLRGIEHGKKDFAAELMGGIKSNVELDRLADKKEQTRKEGQSE